MSRLLLFLALLVVFVALENTVLLALGETRADAYLALAILAYYVLYATLDPSALDTRGYFKYLNAALLLVFGVIVAYRVAEILM